VLVREDVPGDKRLVAYVVGGAPVDVAALRERLAARLPDYMVPAACVVLDALPLTPNGKLDRRALPAPDAGAYGVAVDEAPEGELEARVAAIWCELLQLERVGRQTNFFEAGGHSLLAVQLASRVRSRLGVEVELAQLFAHPTLAGYAQQVAQAGASRMPAVQPVSRGEPLPLSHAQQRLWFLSQLDAAASRAYHLAGGLRLRGSLDRAALQAALDRIVARHEVLRTRLLDVDGTPVQVIDAPTRFALVDGTQTLAQACAEEATLPFDLARGPLIRGRLLSEGVDEHVLLVTMHHVVSDGWSVGVLMRELGALYAAFSQGQADPLAPLALQYADYAVWQRRHLRGELLDRQLAHWREHLQGAPALLALPTERARPAVQDYAGEVTAVALDEALSAQLKALGARHGATLYMTLLAGWAVLMGRLSGQGEVVIGTPVANRHVAELEPLIGFFVNTQALRVRLPGPLGVGELLEQVKATVLSAQAHQDVPFEQVVEVVQPVRSTAHGPLFQVMFSWQNAPSGELVLPGLQVQRLDTDGHGVKSDLELSLQEEGARIVGALAWASALFTAQGVQRLLSQWELVLRAMVADEATPVRALPLLTAPQREQVLRGWNDNAVVRDPGLSVHGLFEAQVRRTPQAVALRFDGQALSYEQLNAKANRLAHRLIGLGVGPEALVAVCLQRSVEMVVALLAVLKAGGAYVPLDPEQPHERLAGMVEDCAPVAVLTQAALLPRLTDALAANTLALDTLQDIGPDTDPEVALAGGHLAYCIYTSGSTGKPKGALNTHEAVVNRLLWMQEAYGLGAEDVVLQKTPYAFDVSVWEFFWPLMVGARLVVAEPQGHRDPQYLARCIREEGVTTLHFVPSMLQAYLDAQAVSTASAPTPSLRRVFCSGEALPVALMRRFLAEQPEVQLHNLYGPTEAAVDVTAWACRADDAGDTVPLGQAISNLQVHVLDEAFEPVPPGVSGQIVIAGLGLARGYLRRAGLTAERFVPDPHGAPGARMYLTGDLGRRRADGALEYLGRNDHQVKIRGLRIELGEVEAALRALPGLREAVVIASQDRLLAYYTAEAGLEHDAAALRTQLARSLPEYMLPSAFVVLQAMPLSANGKLDRQALPAVRAARPDSRYVAPANDAEAALAGIWRDVLQLDRVGTRDNFFDLGGTSLLLLRVHAELARTQGERIGVIDLFQHPTIAQLAPLLRPDASPAAPAEPTRASLAAERGEQRRRRLKPARGVGVPS